ncbi:hypothetical protein Zmor_016437 [Zophobas morio]|uniref:Uncharacterized protein n=1 Tax=Zophobas morio TaxID=2755281 RepID=A0AA38HJB5_9CUCU|nr:hypothetical protein Zmor_016437 [Zophobas morio]
MSTEKQAYKVVLAQEKQAIKSNSADIKSYKATTRSDMKEQIKNLRVELSKAKELPNKKAIIDQKTNVRGQINEAMDNRVVKNEEFMAKYSKPMFDEFNKKVQTY